jgi:hypothetical protein
MRFNLQYVQDANGKAKAVQVPVHQWNSLLNKLSEYEFSRKFAEDLKNGLADVDAMQTGKKPKKTIQEVLNGL